MVWNILDCGFYVERYTDYLYASYFMMGQTDYISLAEVVADYESGGCEDWSERLGIAPMPEGYALMLNTDKTHFFYLRADGKESVIHWDKWAIYRWAKADARIAPQA